MKTCKDCIYYEHDEDISVKEPLGYCHFMPKLECCPPDHWCSQLKEKVHVISDPATDEAPEKTLPSQRLIEKWGEFLDSAIQTAMKFSGNTGQRL